jgi:GTP:adenosylcobinamide-phosphate guanylyltransferase
MDATHGSQAWTVLPQVIEDPASGLTLQFSVSRSGEPMLTVSGDLPLGNREFIFARDGSLAGTGLAPGNAILHDAPAGTTNPALVVRA